MTHWTLADDTHVEIVNFLDDHSRLCIASVALTVARATDVAEIFITAAQRHGTPASVLTDNGCIYTAKYRGGEGLPWVWLTFFVPGVVGPGGCRHAQEVPT